MDVAASKGGKVILDGIAFVDIMPSALPTDGKIKVTCIVTEQAPLAKGLDRLSSVVEFTSSTGRILNQHVQPEPRGDQSRICESDC